MLPSPARKQLGNNEDQTIRQACTVVIVAAVAGISSSLPNISLCQHLSLS